MASIPSASTPGGSAIPSKSATPGTDAPAAATAVSGAARSPKGEIDDAEAVARAREGDHDAFRVLVERYEGRVRRLCERVLRDEEAARDATQDAFIKAYGALRRFEGRSSFYTWLYRLTFNLCLDHKRRDKSARHVDWEDEGSHSGQLLETPSGAVGAVPLGDPARELDRGELREQLAEAIAELPDDARQTLLLREVEGLSYAEIAQALGVPKGTVMSRLHHARKKTREALIAAGVEALPASRSPRDRR